MWCTGRAHHGCAQVIANAVQKAGSQGLYGLVGEVNKTGDDQKKLDVLANDVMINALIGSKKVSRLLLGECFNGWFGFALAT